MKWRLVRRRRRRPTSITKHYLAHKEQARVLVHERLAYWNQFYNYKYNRVAIRNTRRCWGSCTSLKNLNFSYKILFLPQRLQDYIVFHELCHLQELNHEPRFWKLMEKHMPDYEKRRLELKEVEKKPASELYAGAAL
jgi:predicted metal-dependent hydrolase